MPDITLSSAVRSNLLSLQGTAQLLGKTQERLASGLKVNSALDDPNAFFTASSLNSRGSDLNRLLDSVGLSVQTIKAADEGITSITKLVESAQATARQALQSPSAATSYTAATTTGSNTVAADANAVATGSVTNLTGTTTLDTANGSNGLGLVATDTLDITIGSVNVVIDFAATGSETTGASLDFDAATIDNLITEINAQLSAASSSATATLSGGAGAGTIIIDSGSAEDDIVFAGTNFATKAGLADANAVNLVSQGYSGQLDITIGTNATTSVTIGAGGVDTLAELNSALAGANLVGGTASVTAGAGLVIAGTAGSGDSIVTAGAGATALGLAASTNATATGTVAAERTALESQFNSLRIQIDQLSADASFNGNNLLQGDNLTVIFNEDGSSSLGITGVTFNSSGLGINVAATDAFHTDSNINSTLTDLDTAISTLRTQASTFGSNLSVVEVRQDFTKNLINTLETGAANLTLADTNLEGANLLALQTRQQLSSTALSLASQADQNVLRLIS